MNALISFQGLPKTQSRANAFISVMLVLGTLLPALAFPLTRLNLQPLLLSLAGTHPETNISVIVQKASGDNSLEQAVSSFGGTITAELPFINSFGAELPAKAVPSLASQPGIRWVSLDAQVVKTGYTRSCTDCVDTTAVTNYTHAINADQVWNNNTGTAAWLQGQGIGVAVLDSGINSGMYDFTDPRGNNRVVGQTLANRNPPNITDQNGHGTLVAGVIGSNGKGSNGAYPGVAPQAQLVNVKVSDDNGASSALDVLVGLQWIYQNRYRYNIKVVNISFNSTVAQSYTVDPLDMGVEALWLSGITVVVSAGNNGSANLFAPANDPFVITVGAVNNTGTTDNPDWVTAPFSAYGTDETGGAKPDLVAPGTHIISGIANPNVLVARLHGSNLVGSNYMTVAGTSFSAPMVAGAAALLLQANPKLTPDQVKYRLKATALSGTPKGSWDNRTGWTDFDPTTDGAGFLDVQAAIAQDGLNDKANVGIMPNLLLLTALTQSNQSPVAGSSVNWSSVNWSSVNWSSVNWSSVNWSSVNWSSVNWSSVNNYSDNWDN
ncbi:MAG: S8 family serine peptidase [Chloroflexi bacterium]|nr:S8 family serine peptidase [Chloroflexota bacterium]OJV97013.1 MAG: hypothetical protein BGO39_18555 [Chloroflexi bacterium 54-19]